MTNTLTTTIASDPATVPASDPATASMPRRFVLAAAAVGLATIAVATVYVVGNSAGTNADRSAEAAVASAAGTDDGWMLQSEEAAFLSGATAIAPSVVRSWALQPEEAAFLESTTSPATPEAVRAPVCAVGVPC